MMPLWLIPSVPLAGFVVLALCGGRLSPRSVAWLGCGTVAMSFVFALAAAAGFGDAGTLRETVFTWFEAGDLAVDVALYLDPLSLWMTLIVTGVGLLVHIYSAAFMEGDEGFSRYFAYLNLFVAAMLLLVLADNLVVLFAGWEAVGLCSYLLIGHWYGNPENGYAARKAFVVTRLGDVALLIALFVLFAAFGTLDIQPVLEAASGNWAPGAGIALLVGTLVLVGAIGKSAQFPLHVWLPDAMAGPTPVSALIHAATMVTAGVYLIARLHPLFELSPTAMLLVAAVGMITLLIAGLSALVQRDIKRVLAYSTISQIGYMFVALGVGAWSAAIFHLMTHAFFKALLFLGAGLVIRHMNGEHDITRMGGLRKAMPFTAAVFTIGAASLAALPLVTAGFWSKESILGAAWEQHAMLWAGAAVGALVTAVYAFRLVFLVFAGEVASERKERAGPALKIPVGLLALLSVVGAVFGAPDLGEEHAAHLLPAIGSSALVLAGVGLAWWAFGRGVRRPASGVVASALQSGFRIDALYQAAIVRPYSRLSGWNRRDAVDRMVTGVFAGVSLAMHRALSALQTGRVRDYALGMVFGVVVLVGLGVWTWR